MYASKNLNLKIKIALYIGVLIFQSCASFQKNVANPTLLNEKNITELNGKYKILNIEADSIQKKYWTHNNFFREIDSKKLKNTLKLDNLKTYEFELKVIDNKSINFKFLENGKVFKEIPLKGKLKKDGYFYLKNKNLSFWGVPYLAGSIHINKSRLSKTKEGNLIFDLARHQSGAFFLVVFLDGTTWKYRKTYERNQ